MWGNGHSFGDCFHFARMIGKKRYFCNVSLHVLPLFVVLSEKNCTGTFQCILRNLTSVSDVCEGAPISLFWAPTGLNELREERFEFLFILIGQSTMTFLTGQSGVYSNTGTQVGVHNKDFGAVSWTDLPRV